MAGTLIALALAAAPIAGDAAEGGGQPQLPVTPAAGQLFERDWVLMNWALKFYDADGNILLDAREAVAAAAAFRKLADSDNDGRITPDEYREARAFILARY